MSIYGLVHLLWQGKVSLANGRVLSSAKQALTIALLHEHLMDVNDPEPGVKEEDSRGGDGANDGLMSGQHVENRELH